MAVAGSAGSLSKGGNARLIAAGALPATSRSFSSLSRSSSFARTGEFFFFDLLSFSVLLEEEESSSSGRRSSSLASLAARACARVRRGVTATAAGATGALALASGCSVASSPSSAEGSFSSSSSFNSSGSSRRVGEDGAPHSGRIVPGEEKQKTINKYAITEFRYK